LSELKLEVTEFAKLTKIKVKASMNEKALSVEEG
jgi:hypothetical protein